ncbi:MAG: ribose-phosphate pyrophosphokinase [Bacilli bacterium]|nr:ribose-phosphate pyrophosphokinase [Bacilli bacterium]
MLEDAMLFSLSANKELSKAIAKKLGISLSECKSERFPSGEMIVEPIPSVRGKQCFIVQSTCPPVNDNLMETLIFIDALKRASAKEINVIVPYFGYARQDRKAQPRQPITASLVAKLFVTAGAHRVVTINLHAAQIQGFFDCLVDDVTVVPLLGKYILRREGLNFENAVVVSPDHGGVNRARILAEMFDTPIAIIDKRRNSRREPECMNIIGDVSGKDCYMVDDIIDTARSCYIGANALRKAGAKSVKLLAVHPVLSDPAYDLIKEGCFDEIVVTDSIPLPERFVKLGNIQVVSLCDTLADVITRIYTNDPLSDVLK